jgi:hypothetical protein
VFYGRKFSEYHLILYEQAKINTKHTLHDLAGRTLKSIGKAVEDSTPMKLLLATALVHVGGINFDARSNMKIVQTLLSELDSASMCIFVDNVVREFVHPAAPVVDDAQIQENNAENLEAHSLAAFKLSQQENNRISSLECLFALAKNQSLACSHTYVLPMLCSLLCVVGFVDVNDPHARERASSIRDVLVTWTSKPVANTQTEDKSGKKKRKASADLTNDVSDFRALMVKAFNALFGTGEGIPDSSSKSKDKRAKKQSKEESQSQERVPYRAGVVQLARRKLLGLLSEFSNVVAEPAASSSAESQKGEEGSSVVSGVLTGAASVLDEIASFFNCLAKNGIQLTLSREMRDESGNEVQPEEDSLSADCMSSVVSCISKAQELLRRSAGASKDSTRLSSKCLLALKQLLVVASFQVFASSASVGPKVRICIIR